MYGQSIPALLSKNVGNALTNYKTWNSIIYNVKEYGAKGDGITDDTAGIQSALDAARINGGGIVLFPPGTYRNSNILFIGNNVTVRGSGGATIIKPVDNYPSSITPVRIYGVFASYGMSDGFANANITIENLVIDGNREGNSGELANVTPPIHIKTVPSGKNKNIRIRNVEMKNLWKTATAGTFGFWIETSEYVWITDCQIHGTGRDGIAVSTGCKYIHIQGCTIYDTEDDGISLYSTASEPLEHAVVTDNILYNIGSRGVHLAGGKSVVIADNTFDTTASWGILVSDENFTTEISDIEVHKNVIRNASKYTGAILNSAAVGTAGGIAVANASLTVADFKRIKITNNSVYNPAKEGIRIDSNHSVRLISDLSILGNTCDTTGTNGMSFTRSGASLMPKNVKVEQNTVNLSGSVGVKIDASVTNLTFAHNDILDSGPSADVDGLLFVDGANRAVIRDNNITDTRVTKHQNYGISFLGGTFTDTVVENNNVAGNKTSGIFLGAAPTLVQNNRGFNPLGWAAFLTPVLPAGTGVGNAVTNIRQYPVTIHQKGGTGVGIVDVNGAAGDGTSDATVVRLLPGEKIYFNTTVPTFWAWYGE